MRKSLIILAMCLGGLGAFAQDDDVYFVPSSEDNTQSSDTYTAPGRSSYAPIPSDDAEASSQENWADGRGNCGRDVDEYNRRGKNYKGNVLADTLTGQDLYNQGYDDGYEDGSCTARIVRFWSPRAGVYVSSPYYLDFYDLCYYDPWYYGYGWPYAYAWSGWWGWGSWYGWRPWHSSWYWGWGGWGDPWWGGPGYAWGGHGWRPEHWIPSNAERGPVGGWIAYGGRRGSGPATASNARSGISGRSSSTLGLAGRRGFGTRGSLGGSSNARTSRSFGNSSRSFGSSSRSGKSFTPSRSTSDRSQSSSRSSRSFSNERSSRSYSQPSRSSSSYSSGGYGGGSGRSFVGGGGRSGGGGGGGRSFGGRR